MVQDLSPFPRCVGNQAYLDAIELVADYERAIADAEAFDNSLISRVVVAGAFSSGKSSFINHLLGAVLAVEGAAATTRTSTEYVYGNKLTYYKLEAKGRRQRKISRDEYIKESCRKGSTGRFRVVAPSRFLQKNGLVLVDTPGFDDEKNDNDAAKQAIQGADVLFWVVNINDGTLRFGEIDFLKKATRRDVAEVPITFFLSQIDTMNPPKGGSVIDSLDAVRKKIVDDAGGAELRFMSAPVYYSSKPENVLIRSLKPIVKDQGKKLLAIVADCKAELHRKAAATNADARNRIGKMRRSIIKMCDCRSADLQELEKKTLRLEKRRENLIANDLRDAILEQVKLSLECAADNLSASSDCIMSYVSETGLVWDTYTAEFDSSKFSINERQLSSSLAKIFKTRTDFKGATIDIAAATKALAKDLDERTWSVTDDSWSDSARDYACEKMADQLSRILRNDGEELAGVFYDKLTYPSCHFVDDNMSDLDETKQQIQKARSWIDEIQRKIA